MPWERRQRGALYYYQNVRVGGLPRKKYLGTGEEAAAQAERDAAVRQQRQALREAVRAEQLQVEAAETALRDLQGMATLLTRAMLMAAGFYKHRGQWRRRYARHGKADQGS